MKKTGKAVVLPEVEKTAEQLRAGRLVSEKKELDAKIKRLWAFMCSDDYRWIHSDEQDALRRQHLHMGNYSEVLAERIKRLG